jgi:transposase
VTNVTTVGIDLAKNVFSLHGVDAHGNVLMRRTISRSKLLNAEETRPKAAEQMRSSEAADAIRLQE